MRNFTKKLASVLLSALMLIGGLTSEVRAASVPMSEWSTTQTGLPGEESKTQYSYSDIKGYKSTSYRINEESVLSNIYYIDTEYVIYQNGSFLGVGNAYSGDGTTKTYTNVAGVTFKPVQTIYSNKWGFRYNYMTGDGDGGGWKASTAMSHYTYSNYECWSSSGSCSGKPHGYSYSNTINVGPQNVTYNPYGDPVFDYRIRGTGVIGTASNDRSTSSGYRFGIINSYTSDPELNEVNNDYSSESCGSKGRGTSMNTYDWCYESRYGNKTYGPGAIYTGSITNTDGVTVNVEGVNGNITLYENNRKNGGVYGGDTMGSATVNIYGISLIERVYYINTKTDTPRENTVAETWITPEWGPWSSYSDAPAYASATRKVRTRQLYRHPLTYTVNFYANGGTGTMPSITCYYGVACKLPANAFTKKYWKFAGWTTNANGTGTFVTDQGYVNNSNIGELNLYAQWYDDTPPLVDGSINALVDACKVDSEGNVPWTNRPIPVTIKAEDTGAGLNYIGLFKNGNLVHKIGGDLNGAFSVTVQYEVDSRYLPSENYSIRIYDMSGNYAETFFSTECHDTGDPYPKYINGGTYTPADEEQNYGNICRDVDSLGSVTIDEYNYKEIKIKAEDKVSGIKSVYWSLTYKDKWCTKQTMSDTTTETEITIELPETCSSDDGQNQYSLVVIIEDNAGNKFNDLSDRYIEEYYDRFGRPPLPLKNVCGILNSTKDFETDTQLIDFTYVFRKYDEWTGSVESFLESLEGDNNLTSQAAVKFIQDTIATGECLSNGPCGKAEAFDTFLKVYNYDLYKRGLE